MVTKNRHVRRARSSFSLGSHGAVENNAAVLFSTVYRMIDAGWVVLLVFPLKYHVAIQE